MLAIVFAILLIVFFALNMSGAYLIARSRYISEPPGINCASVIASSSFDVLQEKAFIEYKEQASFNYYDIQQDFNEIVSREGFYVCFCKDQIIQQQKPSNTTYVMHYKDYADGKIKTEEAPICQNYVDKIQGLGFLYMQGYSIFIVLLANAVRMLMTYMTNFARSGSRTKQNRQIIAPIAL